MKLTLDTLFLAFIAFNGFSSAVGSVLPSLPSTDIIPVIRAENATIVQGLDLRRDEDDWEIVTYQDACGSATLENLSSKSKSQSCKTIESTRCVKLKVGINFGVISCKFGFRQTSCANTQHQYTVKPGETKTQSVSVSDKLEVKFS
ncbi:hypothetical protein BDP81DRAFT_399188 [Colletotrichum phormii]|uniref:Uncharacterized protein n=1 Tax=Colletotrichum phormii TaxID=359342 RepID=A0AAJ0E9R9_9PEZI|nr:uncharacterized protein BDP81DRAFT_399188 [Colletotrichum phormii]KAK1623851.1 hypothetical protein BDP81DRAFT_399188 [Colletotrichum phormii]